MYVSIGVMHTSRVKISWVAAALLAVGGLVGCAADAAPTASEEDDLKTRPINAAEAEQLLERANECSGNDTGYSARFDVKTFDASKVMAEVKKDDRDAMGVDCSNDHAYSSSRADAVEMFNKHLAKNDWDDRTCLEENLSKSQITRLKAMLADGSNLGVFASIYDGHGDGNSEACAFWTFHVYRADGLRVSLTFNHTD